jgi:hypothetical protein
MADRLAVWLRPLGLRRTNIKRGKAAEVSRYVNKSDFFWDMTPCNVVTIYSHFGGIYCLPFHSERIFIYPEESEAVFFETGADMYDTTGYHISQGNNLYANLGQNLSTSPGE